MEVSQQPYHISNIAASLIKQHIILPKQSSCNGSPVVKVHFKPSHSSMAGSRLTSSLVNPNSHSTCSKPHHMLQFGQFLHFSRQHSRTTGHIESDY